MIDVVGRPDLRSIDVKAKLVPNLPPLFAPAVVEFQMLEDIPNRVVVHIEMYKKGP